MGKWGLQHLPTRPRIFSLMLAAFGLVIVLGVGGMLAVFALAVLSLDHKQDDWERPPMIEARSEARRLAEYYDRYGSWDGFAPDPAELERVLDERGWQSATLLDVRGRVISSSQADLQPGELLPGIASSAIDGERQLQDVLMVQTVPVQHKNEQIGTLVLVSDGTMGSSIGSLARGVIAAGLALGAILLSLATIFSGRISTPLRQMNAAAMAMAEGDLHVRVQPGTVREVADLALSFNQMADALEHADQQRRQLTADVAHELRTPLSIIKGRLEGVQDGIYLPDAEQIAGLLGEVALLERLIEDLRLLALADAGQLALYLEPTAPTQLLHEAARSFVGEATERGVTLRVEAGEDLPDLLVDGQRIAQVLRNLVSNALRHTPTGGVVVLAAVGPEPDDPGKPALVRFSVRDTGVGISPEELPQIFERFYRADRSRSRSSGGAGLGLAITRRIVEAHGGRAWAESVPGRGTTINFSLPLVRDD